MEKLQCEACGASDLVKVGDNVFRCSYCGTSFYASELKQLGGTEAETIREKERIKNTIRNAERLLRVGKAEKAFELLTDVLIIDGDNIIALMLCGKSLLYDSSLGDQKMTQALEYYKDAIEVINQVEDTSLYVLLITHFLLEMKESFEDIRSFLLNQAAVIAKDSVQGQSAEGVGGIIELFGTAVQAAKRREYEQEAVNLRFRILCSGILGAMLEKELPDLGEVKNDFFAVCNDFLDYRNNLALNDPDSIKNERELLLSHPSWKGLLEYREQKLYYAGSAKDTVDTTNVNKPSEADANKKISELKEKRTLSIFLMAGGFFAIMFGVIISASVVSETELASGLILMFGGVVCFAIGLVKLGKINKEILAIKNELKK